MGDLVKTISSTAPVAFALLLAPAAVAQTSAPATPLPDLDGFSLPSSRPTPRIAPDAQPTTGATAPRPAPTPTPSAPVVAAPAQPPRVVPTVRVTPVPRPTTAPRVTVPERPAPVATPIQAPRLTPVAPEPLPTPAAPEPVPTAISSQQPVTSPEPVAASSTPVATATPQPAGQGNGRSSWFALVAGGIAVALGAGALFLWRRRRGEPKASNSEDAGAIVTDDAAHDPVDVAPAPRAVPTPRTDAPQAQRARIEIDCVATRGGTNLLSVAVDYRIIVRNVGDALATGIRVDIRLLGMGTQHDALLSALFAMPIEKSIAAPFDLPPGTAVDLGGMAMHPKDTIETVEIGGRRMVVPLLSVNLRYGWPDDATGGGEGQTARPFVIGIDPGTGGRLQPFRLDAAARMVQNVAIIAYTDGVTT